MLWLVGFLVLGFFGLIGLAISIWGSDEPDSIPKGAGVAVVAIVIFLQIGLFMISSVHVVDSREIGVVKTFGKITGQTDCNEDRNGVLKCGGLTITAPWQTLDTWNVRENFIYAEGEKCKNGTDKCIDAGDKEQNDLFITPKVNIKVQPVDVQGLAAEVGNEYVSKVVRPLMITTIKAVTVKYTATEVHQKRTEIEQEIRARLQDELSRYSIEVTRVTFENLEFSESFNAAIALKVSQNQKALEEENKIKTIEAQAKQAEAAAQGTANARRIAAQAEADANNIINASLTGNILQLRLAQTLGDKVQFLPAGNGILIDPATILKAK